MGDRGLVLLLSSRVVRGSVGRYGCLGLPSVELCFLRFGYSSPSWFLPIFPMSPFLSPLLPVFRQGFSFSCCVGGSSHVWGNSSCSSFYGCLLLLVLALVAVSSCPPLYPSVVCFRFAFLVRIPPSRFFFFCACLRSVSRLLRCRALPCTSLYRMGSSSMLPLFLFGPWVLFCLGRIPGPTATGSALWAESVAFLGFSALLLVPCPAHAFWRLGVDRLLPFSFS